jgi:hypothetical protein
MVHDTLENQYMQNFYLLFDYNQDMNYWDNMLPYERDIYLTLLNSRLEEKQRENGR